MIDTALQPGDVTLERGDGVGRRRRVAGPFQILDGRGLLLTVSAYLALVAHLISAGIPQPGLVLLGHERTREGHHKMRGEFFTLEVRHDTLYS